MEPTHADTGEVDVRIEIRKHDYDDYRHLIIVISNNYDNNSDNDRLSVTS